MEVKRIALVTGANQGVGLHVILSGFTRSSHHTARFAVAISLFQSDDKLDF